MDLGHLQIQEDFNKIYNCELGIPSQTSFRYPISNHIPFSSNELELHHLKAPLNCSNLSSQCHRMTIPRSFRETLHCFQTNNSP